MERFKTVDAFINNSGQWKLCLEQLREILLGADMQETVKWGAPVYTINGKNVVGLGAFKSYAGLWFFNGVFLKDEMKVLHTAQDGKTKALRQWRFSSVEDIDLDLVKANFAQPHTLDTMLSEGRDLDGRAPIDPTPLALPILIVQGAGDVLVPIAVARELDRRAPNSELWIVDAVLLTGTCANMRANMVGRS